ncbi:hypothetical protein [Couchioplanes caeruleus]|uniref:Uncharacterized protein n=2 Tax=Couchioplanes caeruleus TaxID=56438 RepID=A0A1K0FNQ6_9ACTN|nr:hypothetical protein [Couchioplanes caeruleus]OJF14471.1 hypothetical protein BG844_09530 [Couchioplanes caeruleus subsp. caeruleus]ROP21253.1 hypothetical protein EDD30_7649 [Couchioplanes caeruleus]
MSPGPEVVGLDQSIAYAAHLAAEAGQHGADSGQQYLAQLAARGVTGAGLDSGHTMQDAFATAAAAAAAHAAELGKQCTVQQAYDQAPDSGDKTFLTGDAAFSQPHRPAEQETSMTGEPPAPARRGHCDPHQPRAVDGRWIKVEDVLGYADDESCFATDRVTGAGPVGTELALIHLPDEPLAFVVVATPKNGYHPVTSREPDGQLYCAPPLAPDEADTAADHLDELAEMIESGYRPPEPTRHTRARQRLELLLQEDRADRRQRIAVGEEEEFPLSTGELLKLLIEADPTLNAPQTRHAVRARATVTAGGDDGTVWLDISPDAAGELHVVVTAVEGTDDPDSNLWQQYSARHTATDARELAGKLRAFARAARHRNTDR